MNKTNKIEVYTNANKARKASILCTVISLPLIFVFGYLAFFTDSSYFAIGLFGGLFGTTIVMFVMALKNLNIKEDILLISADSQSIIVFTSKETTKTFSWEEISDIKTVKNGLLNKGVAVILKNPNEYMNSLSGNEKKHAKSNKQMYKSPVAINTNVCNQTGDEIVKELLELKSISV